jgi:enoyl-CoA hydratase/carnithine racemase
MADIRLASQDAEFGIPAARLGISLGHGEIRRLVQVVGPSVAKEMLFTAARFDAAWALRAGLVNAVYPGDQLDHEARRVVQSIVDAAPTSVRWSKHAIEVVLDDPSVRGVADGAAEKTRLFGTDEFQEGVRAFLEKRPPRFSGR